MYVRKMLIAKVIGSHFVAPTTTNYRYGTTKEGLGKIDVRSHAFISVRALVRATNSGTSYTNSAHVDACSLSSEYQDGAYHMINPLGASCLGRIRGAR